MNFRYILPSCCNIIYSLRNALISFILTICYSYGSAQGRISGNIINIHQPQTISVNIPFDCWYHKKNSVSFRTDSKGGFTIPINIKSPQFIFIIFEGRRIMAYVEPLKALSLKFDSASFINTLVFSGQLKRENELWKNLGLTFFRLYPETWNDSLASPGEVVSALSGNQTAALRELHAVKSQTSKAFQNITENDIRYYPSYKIWDIIYSNRNPLSSDPAPWRQALIELYKDLPLSNDAAINSHFYQNMITYYPRFLSSTAADKAAFEQSLQKVMHVSATEATEEVKRRGKRYWEFRALQSILKGEALERTMAAFIDQSINIGELSGLQEAYSEFQLRYPKSQYRSHVDSLMDGYFKTQHTTVNSRVVFESESQKLKTLEQVLAKHKGRAVYIDLWGSWCGPCRDQFAYNKPLKDYFTGKPVDFVYIAFEHDRGNSKESWQKTANYYHVTGRHVLVNDQLKLDIEAKFKPASMKGFPTYILVDKEGRIQNLDAKSPSDGNELYKQIESVLR